MKLFHLENKQTQRTPRASAGKVLVTTVSIENKIIGGRAQEQSSPLCDHPMYRMLEAYVLERVASQDEGPAGAHMTQTLLSQPAGPDLSDPPFAPRLAPPTVPVPQRQRPVDRVVPRRK